MYSTSCACTAESCFKGLSKICCIASPLATMLAMRALKRSMPERLRLLGSSDCAHSALTPIRWFSSVSMANWASLLGASINTRAKLSLTI